MENENTIKQIRFYGLSKILIDQVGRKSSKIINDILSDSIKKRGFDDILDRYFTPKQKKIITIELEKSLSEKKAVKIEPEKKVNQTEESTILEIEAKGFNI